MSDGEFGTERIGLTEQDLQEWLKTADLPPFVELSDVGKTGAIVETGWVDTKYGRKLRIVIDLNGEKKTVMLSKLVAKSFRDRMGIPVDQWIGKKVKVIEYVSPRGTPKAGITPEV